eukprot:m.196176 g.196176  ORF g.196176 m.196176 type:complete len:115 (-) comp14903_c0_seq4:159-503(-)
MPEALLKRSGEQGVAHALPVLQMRLEEASALQSSCEKVQVARCRRYMQSFDRVLWESQRSSSLHQSHGLFVCARDWMVLELRSAELCQHFDGIGAVKNSSQVVAVSEEEEQQWA